MILDITIKNFRSFLQETTFSMEATSTLSKEDNVISIDKIGRVLKSGVIFGPNAAGKSNFVTLVYFVRAFILGANTSGSLQVNLYSPFVLRDKNTDEPSSFTMRFVVNGTLYNYNIEVLGKRILKESLACEHGDGDVELLIERGEEEKEGARIMYGNRYNKSEIRVTITPKGQSILTPFLYVQTSDLSNVAIYIRDIQFDDLLYFPSGQLDDRIPMLRHWMQQKKERKEKLLQYFQDAGIDVKDISFKNEPLSGRLNVYFTHEVYDNNHVVVGLRKFPYEAESNGTIQLLFYAMRAISAFETGSPMFADEFNDGLHTQVSQTLMDMFRSSETNPKGAQLIATTHDLYLMDENNLRRDQIWFVNKSKEGVSELYSLVEFQDTNEETPFAKWYLANRFGALPLYNRNNNK
jgi:AAA15 family ATPase/GTPase